MDYSYAYLHGFGSSPQARKAVDLRARLAPLGIELLAPDLNAPSFEKLSQGAMLDRLDEFDHEHGKGKLWRLIGSSMGGWLAARWAELRPERVDALLLLCPAFDLAARWPRILPEGALERWKEKGALMLPDSNQRLASIHYGLYEESLIQPARPTPKARTLVIHGIRDDRIPVQSSRDWISAHPNAELIEVDDGHDLVRSIDVIEAAARRHFELDRMSE